MTSLHCHDTVSPCHPTCWHWWRGWRMPPWGCCPWWGVHCGIPSPQSPSPAGVSVLCSSPPSLRLPPCQPTKHPSYHPSNMLSMFLKLPLLSPTPLTFLSMQCNSLKITPLITPITCCQCSVRVRKTALLSPSNMLSMLCNILQKVQKASLLSTQQHASGVL